MLTNSGVRAPVQHTFWSALNEQFWSSTKFARFQWNAVRRHRFAVSRELQCKFFLPFSFDVLAYDNGRCASVQTLFRHVEWIQFLS